METESTSSDVTLTVDLPGIIRIFGMALYNEFGAIVRELVQNSHDSIIKTYAELRRSGKNLEDYRIDVEFDQYGGGILVVADTGSGMTKSEIADDLNHFGQSVKRDLRASLETADTPLHIIGEYGVGFLSAMAASDKVEVWTRKNGHSPARWNYTTGQTSATVSEINGQAFSALLHRLGLDRTEGSGTVVICHLSERVQREYHVDSDLIRESLLHYTCILPVGVYFNGEKLSNRYRAWGNPCVATEDDWKEVIQETTGLSPLLVVPIYSPPGELDLEGVLWIPPRIRFLGDAEVDIYIRRLYVTSDDHIIKPEWARFVRGMINSNVMSRIVSGNAIIEDANVERTRQFIEKKLVDVFQNLRGLPDDEYWRIVGPHDDTIKKSAVDSIEFMECVWDKLRVKAQMRRITMPEYISLVERKTGRSNIAY
jgi:molecular chaperone HtpG